jgi:hypothetical protein
MWTCLGCYSWINYDFYGSEYYLVKGSILRQHAIYSLLKDALNLESLNIFLYTWRSLAALEREEVHLPTKKALRWYATLTGWTLPLLLYCFYVAIIIASTYYFTFLVQDNADASARWRFITVYLAKFFGYLTTFTNCLACFTMVLIVRFARKLTQPAVTALGDI